MPIRAPMQHPGEEQKGALPCNAALSAVAMCYRLRRIRCAPIAKCLSAYIHELLVSAPLLSHLACPLSLTRSACQLRAAVVWRAALSCHLPCSCRLLHRPPRPRRAARPSPHHRPPCLLSAVRPAQRASRPCTYIRETSSSFMVLMCPQTDQA